MERKNSVVYQIYVKSFCDSNGDGIGDLNGIRAKLPYLKSLGVDYIWVTPFFPSPMFDNGYDVADYCAVNPMFGTMSDCEAMIAEADKLGIGFMFDMVFNHTSWDHEWFKKALTGDPEYMDYYIFRDGVDGKPPLDWTASFGTPAWEYVPQLDKWYLHLFDKSQPDLNWENPKVRDALKDVIRFWKGKGVKGFRFDVLNLVSKPEHLEQCGPGSGTSYCKDGHRIHEFIREMVTDTGIENMMTVGEMASTTLENCIRYSNPESRELAMCFNFHHLKVDYKNGDKWALMEPDLGQLHEIFRQWQEEMSRRGGWNAVFWCNHDQPRIVSRFGDEGEYWKQSAKMLGTFIHFLRGTPYVYQGEELGMTNAHYTNIAQYNDVECINYYKILLERGLSEQDALEVLARRSRDNSRTPMQWNAGQNAGFTDGSPWLEIPDNYSFINVEAEEEDPDSILHYYRTLIRLRKKYPIIAEGEVRFLDTGNGRVFAYERSLDGQRLTVVCNFSGQNETANVDLNAGTLLLCNGAPDQMERLQDGALALRPYEAFAVLN
ncbi:MAG: alpha,alpha-phosphotrehalase [Oscillospiraceae bacterium]|nr:alpha,alpha-phosphotrehalase [Oscillospiraceae bacterium]